MAEAQRVRGREGEMSLAELVRWAFDVEVGEDEHQGEESARQVLERRKKDLVLPDSYWDEDLGLDPRDATP